jgi:hypothetical protein
MLTTKADRMAESIASDIFAAGAQKLQLEQVGFGHSPID